MLIYTKLFMTIINVFGKNKFNIILLGFLFHSIGVIFYNSSKTICYLFCGLGLFLVFGTSFLLMHKKKTLLFSNFFKILFKLYILYNLIILLRPLFSYNYFYSKESLSPIIEYMWLSYLVPIIGIICWTEFNLKNILYFVIIYFFLGFSSVVLNKSEIFSFGSFNDYQTYISIVSVSINFFLIPSFLLLWFNVLNNKLKLLAFVSWLCGIFISAFSARRTNLIVFIILLFFGLLLNNKRKILNIILIILIYCLFVLFENNNYFSLLIDRFNEDTRSGVEFYFYNSFKYKTVDWIFGRGLNGTYYCPFFDDVNRNVIETGYLYYILKGGILYLILFLLILVHSFYLGFFKSNSFFIKGMSFFILLHFLELFPFGIPMFNIEYLFLWICIFFCESKNIRGYSDSFYLKFNNY